MIDTIEHYKEHIDKNEAKYSRLNADTIVFETKASTSGISAYTSLYVFQGMLDEKLIKIDSAQRRSKKLLIKLMNSLEKNKDASIIEHKLMAQLIKSDKQIQSCSELLERLNHDLTEFTK